MKFSFPESAEAIISICSFNSTNIKLVSFVPNTHCKREFFSVWRFHETTCKHFVFLINTQITTLPSLRRYGELNTCTVLRSEIPSGICAKLRTVAASKNTDHARNLSSYCLLALRIHIFVLRAHPVRGEPHNQRNTPGEVARTAT